MAYENEIVTLGEADISVDVVRRGYQLEIKNPPARPDETIFSALGEYAIRSQNDKTEPWQFLPAERMSDVQYFDDEDYPGMWASAEKLRTRSGNGLFLPAHMDLLDAALFREQRLTSPATKLTIASEADLQTLFAKHGLSPDQARPTDVHDIFNYINHADKSEAENVTLHNVEGRLYLASAQTMLDVFFQAVDGAWYKLRETEIIRFDPDGSENPAEESKLRSSMGETGHLIDGRPERPWVTARRGLWEELGLEDDDHIVRIVSTGNILRLKPMHHSYGFLGAEDRTHYFKVLLDPATVQDTYINEERDPDGILRKRITLKWFMEPPTSLAMEELHQRGS